MTKELKVFLGIIIGLAVFIGGLLVVNAKTPGKYDEFAQCITDSGTKFFGAYWCPHCAAQKALFGKSAKKLPYYECALQGEEKAASDKAIQQAIIDGKLKIGTDGNLLPGQDPEKLGIKVRADICKENNIDGYPTWVFPKPNIVVISSEKPFECTESYIVGQPEQCKEKEPESYLKKFIFKKEGKVIYSSKAPANDENSWIFIDEERASGEQTFAELAAKTSCIAPK